MKRPRRPRRRYAFPSCWARRIVVASAGRWKGRGSWEEMKNWGVRIGAMKPARLRLGLVGMGMGWEVAYREIGSRIVKTMRGVKGSWDVIGLM